MIKRTLIAVVLSIVVLAYSGCDRGDDNNDEKVVEQQTQQTDDDSGDNDIDNDNDSPPVELLNIKGLINYSDGESVNEYKDMEVRAEICNNAKEEIGEGCTDDFGFVARKDENVVVYYDIVSNGEYNSEYDYYEKKYEYHLAVIDANDMSVKKDVICSTSNFPIIKCYGDKICVNSVGIEEKSAVVMYDINLNIVDEIVLEVESSFYPNSTATAIYYCKEAKLYKYDVATKEEQNIIPKENNYTVNYVEGCITGSDGKDYLILNADAVDYKNYEVVVDMSTGNTEKMLRDSSANVRTIENDNIIFANCNERKKEYIIADGSNNATSYSEDGESYSGISVLSDGRIVFTLVNEYEIKAFLFDKGKLCASSTINVQVSDEVKNAGKDLFGEGAEYENIVIIDQPRLAEDNKILINCRDIMSNIYCIVWDAQSVYTDNMYEVKDFDVSAVESVVISSTVDVSQYAPGELSESLLPLREKADEMENKYHIEIEIGEPCRNVIGGYAINELTSYDDVEYALTALEQQLEKYPENFFSQFEYDNYKGLLIYLSGTLQGVDEYNLDYAGGFQNVYNDYMIMVIDASSSWNVEITFNHELCHSIEDKIEDKYAFSDDYCLNDNKWNTMNPTPDGDNELYTYDYSKFGYDEYLKYAVEYDEINDNTYFVDSYSMTYPTEDRARLFEEVMSGRYCIDFENAPHLKEKMNYFCECIRSAFDTTGWENVYWERYQ